jgi:aspartate kinase
VKRAGHTVEKIGGTSMLATDVLLENVLIGAREDSELYGRIFVVSAYAGITDMLLEHKRSGVPGVFGHFTDEESEWAWGNAMNEVAEQLLKINAGIFSDDGQRVTADNFVRERIEGVRNCLIDLHRLCSCGHFNLPENLRTVRELLASLGEAHSAHNTALLLNSMGINARFVDLTGWRGDTCRKLDDRITAAFRDLDLHSSLPVATGYAQCDRGVVSRYGRGYSEVTFSRIAALTRAREAIIHKEFHLSSADPKIVGEGRVRTIGQTNYDVADQLSNLGMEAIHPRAAKGLRRAGIPLRVKNTFDAGDSGTAIDGDYTSDSPRVEIVTGIRGVYALQFFEQDMVGVKGYDAKILRILKHHAVRVVTKSSNANTITHYLAGVPRAVKRVIDDLEKECESSSVSVSKVAIVSAIGSDLKLRGLTGSAVAALSAAGIEILGVHQLLRNVDIMFILDDEDYEPAIRALHAALIESGSGAAEKSASRAA